MLQLSGAARTFGTVTALHPTDLDLPAGRTTVLIGPSGCGKSTVLRLIAGLLTPTAGEVRFDGQAITPTGLRAIRLRIGYVIQDGGLFPHLSGRGNITLMSRHLGWPRGRADDRLAELAELVQMDPAMLDRYPVQLSGGQQQRVSLMRALMLDPDVLLLDEPLGALDPMIRADLQNDLRSIFQRLGKTVVMVTHDLAEAAFFADDIVLMSAGRIVQQGSFESLRDAPASEFVKRFVHAQRMLHGE